MHRALPSTSEEPPPLPKLVRQPQEPGPQLLVRKALWSPFVSCADISSLLAFLCSLCCGQWLSDAELRAHCPGQGRRLSLPAVSAYACRRQAGRTGCPPCDVKVSSVAKQRSPACPRGSPPWDGGVCPPASTRTCSWPCCGDPACSGAVARDPAMSTSKVALVKNTHCVQP